MTLVFFIISTINMSYTFATVMTPRNMDVPLTFVYKQAYAGNNYGFGMAATTIMFIISFALALLSNKLTARDD